jgi:hypothetical protein
MRQEEEFRAYMKVVNRTSSNEPHLNEAQLIAYYRGEMSGADHEAAQAHLVGCQQCVALFRSVRDFLEPVSAEENEITDAETNEAWQSLSQRLKIQGRTDTVVTSHDFTRARNKRVSIVSLALAASLFLSLGATGWLSWRVAQERRQSQELATQSENKQRELEQRLAQLEQSGNDQIKHERELRLAAESERDQLQHQLATQPQAEQDVPVYIARLTSERGTGEEVKLHLTSAAPALKLQLMIGKPYEFPEYAIELFDERGQIIRRITKVRPSGNAGALSVRLNRTTFQAGKYRLRLFGRRETAEQQLGDYVLAVTVER